MELYVKMTDEEYEEYKAFKQSRYAQDNDNIEEYLKRNGFEASYTSVGRTPMFNKNVRLRVYEKDNCTVKIEEELL